MKLSKVQREVLRQKFGGRCAYCGAPLGDRWHADHIENVERVLKRIPGRGLVCTAQMHRPERDTMENMNPACAPCNIDKHSMTLEGWRSKLQQACRVLRDHQPTYRHALRFGLLQETGATVVFYFEAQRVIDDASATGQVLTQFTETAC